MFRRPPRSPRTTHPFPYTTPFRSSLELPYEDLARIPLMMEKVDDDHVFSGEFSVVPVEAGQALPAELRVEVLVEGRTIAVQVDRDGRMHLPIRQDWVD